MRRAILIFRCETQPCVISIHALHEESDLVDVIIDTIVKISIHALHEESDSHIATVDGGDLPISIHALHEESDSMSCTCVPVRVRFQSTLSMRRAINISVPLIIATSISIHALHEESDLTVMVSSPAACLFQSTLSMRRAIRKTHAPDNGYNHFNPRSP